jgi:CheY-like chemotaxis protein
VDAPRRGATAPSAGAALRRISTVRGSHVLLVENSPSAVRVAVYVLKRLGCVVRAVDEAAGAVAAVVEAAAAGASIDVVVMNFAREGAAPHGNAVLAAMRGAGQPMPLLLYTSDAMRPGGERYHSVGFAGEPGQRVWTDVAHLAVAQALATAWPPARDAPARAATEPEMR